MRGPASHPIVIAAGGTGGHFFPAEALAAILVERGYRVVLLTDRRSGAASSQVFAGREQFILHGSGLAGRGLLRGASAMLGMAWGTWQARRVLRRLLPAAVVAFGGYPSIAPVLAARSLRRKPRIMLQEQNAVLGRANRILARHADILALGFSETRAIPAGTPTIFTGNPVRLPIEAVAGAPFPAFAESFHLLVLGGSLGARIFSDVVPAAIALLPEALRAALRVTQQCRSEDLQLVAAQYQACGVRAELAVFFPGVAERLASAHFVVARAGASTCAEITAVGRPAILVPLPGAIDGHQLANVESLVAEGGAVLCVQPEFHPEYLAARLVAAMSDYKALAALASASAACGRPHAARDLADAVERLLVHEEASS